MMPPPTTSRVEGDRLCHSTQVANATRARSFLDAQAREHLPQPELSREDMESRGNRRRALIRLLESYD